MPGGRPVGSPVTMKTRLLPLLAAFALAAPALAQPAPGPTIPDANQTPPHYVKFGTYTMEQLIESDASVTWTCWVHELDAAGKKRRLRTTAWLVGEIENRSGAPLDVDLHVIGAQHRSHVVLVRVVSDDPHAKIYQTVMGRAPTDRALQKEAAISSSFPGKFYQIEISNPQPGAKPDEVTFLNRYSLRSTHSKARIEVFFAQHPPGTLKRQLEDGAPPPIPPIGLEK